MSATKYEYDVLKKDTSIRLLKIEPMATIKDSSSDPHHSHVSCTLKTFNDHIPPYSALSYCWGDTKKDRQHMYLGDTLIEVHKNLWEFLHQMQRSGQTETWFWTDFLCLNQGSDDEKGKQIPRMGTIYAEAEETISWLGCEGPPANQHAANLGDHLKHIETRVPETREVVENFFKKLPNWTTLMNKRTSAKWSGLTEPSDEEENAIRRLGLGQLFTPVDDILSQDYWERVWIVQEVAMGNRVKLAYGPVSIDLDDLFLPYKCRLYYEMKTDGGKSNEPSGTKAAIQARAARLDKDISMHRILQWGMRCQSTRIHDRIYGLLGLLRSYDSRESSTSGSLTESSYSDRFYRHCMFLKRWVFERVLLYGGAMFGFGRIVNRDETPFGSLKVDYKRNIAWVFWDVVFACRASIKEEADGSDLIDQFLEITNFFPRLADSLDCSFSLQSLRCYFVSEGDLPPDKEMTQRMISLFRSVGSGILLSTTEGIYSNSTRFPPGLLRSLRIRPNPDPDPDSKFRNLQSDLATIFLECVDSGVDKSAEIHAALIALRLAQKDDLGSGDWSCVPTVQDKPGHNDGSSGKRKILERQVRWATGPEHPGDHGCSGSSLYLNLPDPGWNLRLDIQDDIEDEDWIHGKLSITLNSTFSQPRYGNLVLGD